MPFSLVFYKWMLGQEESLTLEDLIHIDPNLYEHLKKFQTIVHHRDRMEKEHDPRLLLDGCPIEDLSLVFTLPGHSNIELKKAGKDCLVTLDNLDQYVNVSVTARDHPSSQPFCLVDRALDVSRRCSSTVRIVPRWIQFDLRHSTSQILPSRRSRVLFLSLFLERNYRIFSSIKCSVEVDRRIVGR